MAYIEVDGTNELFGEITIQGSKNAVLPLLAASVLVKGEVQIRHCPHISDIQAMLDILKKAGSIVTWEKNTLILNTKWLQPFSISQEEAVKTRTSILFLGALLGRFGEARLCYPGGCLIGKRPIDLHCMIMQQLHSQLISDSDCIYAVGKPVGATLVLPFPSVGATENAILASVLAKGTTKICGGAKEPEIIALCNFLNKAGAKIKQEKSTGIWIIEGVDDLHSMQYDLPADRIVAGTYLTAVASVSGEVVVKGVEATDLAGFLPVLEQTGVQLKTGKEFVWIKAKAPIHAVKTIITAPFPAFPTDMQSQMMALLTRADGVSVIEETIFEGRFLIAEELRKMGALLEITRQKATIFGVKKLTGAIVCAKDLRGGAALVIAGLSAEGRTQIKGYHYIARGYEDICRDFTMLGAKMKLVTERD